MKDNLHSYFELKKERPQLFEDSETIPIEYDIGVIEDFEKQNNRTLGVVYQSKYNTLVVDLIKDKSGYYTYERVIPTSKGTPVVVLAKYNNTFVLLRQFRHAFRDYQIACVRGFGDDTVTDGVTNAAKEILEEVSADIISTKLLGQVSSDSGLTSSIAEVYLCEITEPVCKPVEGITKLLFYHEDQIKDLIRRKCITDGYTLSAFMLYFLHEENNEI